MIILPDAESVTRSAGWATRLPLFRDWNRHGCPERRIVLEKSLLS